VEGETLETHAPNFWRWLDRAASGNPTKRNVILAALFMVLANRYDWQLFLEVRPRRQREKYSRRNRHDAGRRG
jgi:putative DNA primase/helicase